MQQRQRIVQVTAPLVHLPRAAREPARQLSAPQPRGRRHSRRLVGSCVDFLGQGLLGEIEGTE